MNSRYKKETYIKRVAFFKHTMNSNCPIFKASNIIGKKWTILIILEIYKGSSQTRRYNELKKRIPLITPKILSSRLKELINYGIINKKIDATSFPIKSNYKLTKSGKEFMKIIEHLKEWALKNQTKNKICENTTCELCDL